MRRLHKVSGTAVTVSSKTVGAILETLDYVVDRLSGPSQKGVPGSSHGQLGPPPLPPRNALPMQSIPGHLVPGGGPPLPPRKPGLLNSVLASTDLLLTTLERSAQEVIETGTNAVSASLAHKYVLSSCRATSY
jgi:spartin